MKSIEQYKELLSEIRGKVVAIVYIFECESAKGFKHYDIWRGDLIGEWVQSVHELRCLPLIFDTRTFVQKAMENTLPKIDYVVNLNNGNIDISTLGLIPSVCSFLSIPCIPCNTVSIIAGEHKLLSNLIAYAKKMNIPKDLDRNIENGILRPFAYGSSIGVKRNPHLTPIINTDEYLYQEFISGFDITTPLLYNPLTSQLEVLPSVMYRPNNNDMEWYLGEDEKKYHEGYKKCTVQIDDDVKEKYISLAKSFSINTYCRIDARIRCDRAELNILTTIKIPLERVYFLEINPMPTIKNNINFHTSMQNLVETDKLFECFKLYQNEICESSTTGFILSCSMISLFITKYEK